MSLLAAAAIVFAVLAVLGGAGYLGYRYGRKVEARIQEIHARIDAGIDAFKK